jgi:hypothetical protein
VYPASCSCQASHSAQAVSRPAWLMKKSTRPLTHHAYTPHPPYAIPGTARRRKPSLEPRGAPVQRYRCTVVCSALGAVPTSAARRWGVLGAQVAPRSSVVELKLGIVSTDTCSSRVDRQGTHRGRASSVPRAPAKTGGQGQQGSAPLRHVSSPDALLSWADRLTSWSQRGAGGRESNPHGQLGQRRSSSPMLGSASIGRPDVALHLEVLLCASLCATAGRLLSSSAVRG